MTGRYAKIRRFNEREAFEAHKRDQAERNNLVFNQISERQNLQVKFDSLNQQRENELQQVRSAVIANVPNTKLNEIERLNKALQHKNSTREITLEM